MLQQVADVGHGEQWQVCEVCRRLDGNLTPRLCRWCNMCGAWICRRDWRNLARRALAALWA